MRSLLAALLIGFSLAATPAAAQRTGLYEVFGTSPDGTPYTGRAAIRQVGIVSWQIIGEIAGNRIEGVAMSSGPNFAVVYELGEQTGMGIYSVGPDGTLTGQWTLIGSTAFGTETLTPR